MTSNRSELLPDASTTRRVLRLALGVLLVVTLLSAGHSFLTYDAANGGIAVGAGASDNGAQTAAGTTSMGQGEPAVVATIDGVGPGQIVAYDANGSVVYHNSSRWIYHDVDPSPAGEHTVSYVASDPTDSGACPGEKCLLNTIEQVNLTTGEMTQLHAWADARNGSTQTHDVDRINESVFLVADISFPDRVYMVNTTTGEEIWEWRVSDAFEPESGGDYPSDWTHLNDAEYLSDGRVMANLRNQDQVVFTEPGEGVQEDWTLGADGDHDILFEAHNPDYIPEARGGPAVVVADSENNRLVEYQRENGGGTSDASRTSSDASDGSWTRSWLWQDTTMQWPRDADRLPSGRTLVADSHGQRVMSVEPSGAIAWSRSFPTGSYDVELLGTGDESATGTSAAALDLTSRRPGTAILDGNTSMRNATVGPGFTDNSSTGNASSSTGPAGGNVGTSIAVLVHSVVSLVPPIALHGLLFVLPTWATAVDATLILATLAVGGGWLLVEAGAWLSPQLRRIRDA